MSIFNPEGHKPIKVVVSNHRYDCFSLNPEPTLRDIFVMEVIKKMGGISDQVKPGVYHCQLTKLRPFGRTKLDFYPVD